MHQNDSYFLYCITNTLDNKQYIGMTADPKRRWREHRTRVNEQVISKAIISEGVNNFKFVVMCEGSKQYIKDLEEQTIIKFGTLIPDGYNKAVGSKMTDEFKVKASDFMKKVDRTGWKQARKGVSDPLVTCLACKKALPWNIFNRFHGGNHDCPIQLRLTEE